MATLNSGKVIGADGQFISVEDTERYLGVPDENGKVLASNTDGTRFWTVSTGAQGSSGPQGAQGVQGSSGVGSQGAQGVQGSPGPQGAQGVQGSPGVGSQGSEGAQGAQGVQGSPGPQGAQGATGVQGETGSQGAASNVPGPQGVQGPQGSAGTSVVIVGSVPAVTTSEPHTTLTADDTGFSWYQPSSGNGVIDESTGNLWVYSGTNWNNVGTIVGPQGPQGLQGVQGAQGAASNVPGPQGVQGSAGAQGAQGVQGSSGVGSQGSAGAQGVQGSPGPQGAQGVQGSPGVGSQGSAGAQGARGLDGGTGPQGPQGAQGHQGRQGSAGAQGVQGSPGVGAQGAPGPSTEINASAVDSGVIHYPVFVTGTGPAQPRIRTATTAFSYNPTTNVLTVPTVSGNATTATNLLNAGTVTLATETESNSIYITQPLYDTDLPVKLLNFDWYGNLWSLGNIRSGSTPSNGFGVYSSGTERARFTTTGLTVTGDVNSTSDIKLKTNIKTLTNSLEKVCSLRGVEFDRIDIEGKHQIGFIAQELEEIVPELVSESNDIKSVAYGNITALLVEALKELKERVEVLEQNSKY